MAQLHLPSTTYSIKLLSQLFSGTLLPVHTITARAQNTAQLTASLITTHKRFGPHPGQFTASTHCRGGWVGTKVGMDIFKDNNLLPLPQIKPTTSKPVGQSLY